MTSCISFLHEWLKNFSVLACTPPSCSNAAKYDKGMNYKFLVGNIRSKISQPASSEYLPMPRMNVITEEVSYSTIREEDSGPSCSLAEALRKQDLFINSMLAQIGCDILWRMFREGRTFYRGAYLNLDTLRVNPIPV